MYNLLSSIHYMPLGYKTRSGYSPREQAQEHDVGTWILPLFFKRNQDVLVSPVNESPCAGINMRLVQEIIHIVCNFVCKYDSQPAGVTVHTPSMNEHFPASTRFFNAL